MQEYKLVIFVLVIAMVYRSFRHYTDLLNLYINAGLALAVCLANISYGCIYNEVYYVAISFIWTVAFGCHMSLVGFYWGKN